MAYFGRYVTSLYGRRFGLQLMSSNAFGVSKKAEMLVGPEDIRKETSTAETTSSNLRAWGHSVLIASSVGSSQVWTIDPPIPGVLKTVIFGSTIGAVQYLKSANGEFFKSTQGTTMNTLSSTNNAYCTVTLVPESTGSWAVLGSLSSGFVKATTST